ncbi:MAG TPA: amino acid permease [Candidatus Eisenbacteria bacterium]|nr:amino acid permease [Candidatus Eisenbacteria bacterium]
MSETTLKPSLTFFDVTNLVVGAIIGADIYVASSFGAGLLGPFSLVVWVVAGLMAIILALCFAQCASLLPKVGGPYAYAHAAWGSFAGFTVGWALWLAEWMSLAVFPVAFTQYLMVFIGLNWILQIVIKALFVAFLITTNVIGVRAAGRTNDVLTILKIAPLIFFMVIGLGYVFTNTTVAAGNFSPFSPFGFSNFGLALVLIFWAYAGFELSTIPAGEIKDPGRTIPKAIVLGISIVTFFYLTTNFVLLGVRNYTLLANDTTPLVNATKSALNSIPALAFVGGLIVGVGALISVTGSDESGMIGTSRLGYALAADGLFPRIFAKIHPKYKTPYLGIIVQAITALIAALIGNLNTLIATSVFFLAIAYVATCASTYTLKRKGLKAQFTLRGGMILPILGIIFSVYLITQCTLLQIGLGLILLVAGIPMYIKYSPKKEMTELESALLSSESVMERAERQEQRFLANVLRHVKHLYRRTKRSKQPQAETENSQKAS